MPYVPGLLSFRELPALIAALEMLTYHAGPGLSSTARASPIHATAWASLRISAWSPVCCASAWPRKRCSLPEQYEEPGPLRGDRTVLLHRGEQIGWVLRSKPRCKPLIVSPGHRVSMAKCGAVELVVRSLGSYRLPEPTRLADRLASKTRGAPHTGNLSGETPAD